MKRASRYKTFRDYLLAQPREKTQRAIAKELGLSEAMVSSMKNGYPCNRETAKRISPLIGVSITSLMGIEQNNEEVA